MNHIRPDGAPSYPPLWPPPFVTTPAQGHRTRSWIMTPRPAPLSRNARCRATPIPALGAAVKHGASMASRTVRDTMCSCLPYRPQFGPLFVVVVVYSRTQVVDYLDTARRMADYFLNNIPADGAYHGTSTRRLCHRDPRTPLLR
jgi:hypothetical protein